MDRNAPPMSSSPTGPLDPAWVAWVNRAALEAVAADEGEAADDLVADAVAQTFSNPLHQDLMQRLRRLNPSLFRRLVQAKALAPFVVWLVHQQQERAMELRRSNVQEASSRAALEIYSPFLGADLEDEQTPEVDEVEPGIERELVEYLASLNSP